MKQPSYLEQLHACRPRPDELAAPECSELKERLENDPQCREQFERVLAWDARIADALNDVAPPAGLLDQILAQTKGPLPSQGATAAAADERHASASDSMSRRDAPLSSPLAGRSPVDCAPRRSRRLWLGVVAGAGLLGLVLAFGWPRVVGDSTAALGREATEWLGRIDPTGWRAMHPSPPGDHPPLVGQGGFLPQRWQQFATSLDPGTVVYDYGRFGAGPLLLFVSRPDHAIRLPEQMPLQPQYQRGWNLAVWRQFDLVYVLALEGSARDYQQLIQGSQRLAQAGSSRPLRRGGPARAT